MNESLFTVIEKKEGRRATFEVLEYNQLPVTSAGSSSSYYAKETGVKLKQVRITLRQGAVQAETGALQFIKGDLQMKSNAGGVGGFMKKVASNILTDESLFKPLYEGTGEIYLEPSYGHYLLLDLNEEEVVADKGMFYAAEPSVHLGVARQKLMSSIKGDEGLFQTKLNGSGFVVLQSPVPLQQIMKVELNEEKLQVDGTFALLRKGDIDFRVKRASSSIVGSATSGEGYLHIFEGTGEVWLAPTLGR
ncbi:AIM24 family protein [Bacillus sp. NEB1478]|uniref:AIM24 family protein n=1 Tax=Bacillus sp. NEB1478 TaxID=3073816 RepID=UPI002872E005|nr:AIM24 family protein [Bacillus sp. NEB1478]WNB91658.1 AIM24 family protein [Bacillus sp. NEB1478]